MDDLDDITILAIIAAFGIVAYFIYQAATSSAPGAPSIISQANASEAAIASEGPLYYATLGAYGPGGWLVDTNSNSSGTDDGEGGQ